MRLTRRSRRHDEGEEPIAGPAVEDVTSAAEKTLELLQRSREREKQLRVAVERLRAQLARKEEQVQELRSKLLDTRAVLNARISALREEVQDLRSRLVPHERRLAVADINALLHNEESSMDEFFSAIADESPYVEFGAALREELGRIGISFDGRRVADAGVGPGLALRELLRGSTPSEVVGFDFSARALDHARRLLPQARFECHGIYDLPAGDFDIVICTEVLEHLERPHDALRAVAGMVGVDGFLVLTVPDGRIDFSDKHVNFWSPESWRLFLERELAKWEVQTRRLRTDSASRISNNLAVLRRPDDLRAATRPTG